MKPLHTLNPVSVKRLTGRNARKLYNLLLSDDEKEDARKLIKRGKKLSPKINYGTVAYIFREGARKFIEEQNRLLDKAEAGELHAKQRTTTNHKAAKPRK